MRSLTRLIGVIVASLAVVDPVFAQESSVLISSEGMGGLAIAIAAFGGAMGQSKAISAALEAIGRNPGAAGQMFLPWLLALILIETLVIYALIVALKLAGVF